MIQGAARIATTVLLIFAVWHLIVWAGDLRHFILPSPLRTLSTLWRDRMLIGEHALITLAEIAAGLVLGIGLGILTAIQLAMSSAARRHLRPVLVFLQAVPFFALAPILAFWLGFGIWPKVVMAMLIIYFPVTSTFFDGLIRTPQGYLDLARAMGAGPWRVLWQVRIPAAMPSLASGLRLGAVFTPIGAVIGEWVGGAGGGLGYLMLLANGRAKIDQMFAIVLVICTIAVLLYWLSDRIGHWLTERYA